MSPLENSCVTNDGGCDGRFGARPITPSYWNAMVEFVMKKVGKCSRQFNGSVGSTQTVSVPTYPVNSVVLTGAKPSNARDVAVYVEELL